MTFAAWLLIGYFVATGLLQVLSIGKSVRIDPGSAVVSLVVDGLLILAVLSLAGGS